VKLLLAILERGRYRAGTAMGKRFPYDEVTDSAAAAAAQFPHGNVDECKVLKAAGIHGAPGPASLRMALEALITLKGARRAEDPVKVLERKLVGTKIPGFFPTPRPLAARMVELAQLRPGDAVLEPSAGNGHIADAIRDARGEVLCVECNFTLAELLIAKGHNVHRGDFLAFDIGKDGWLAAVMNPPFEDGADIEHVRHAASLLRSGGIVVAIVGAGTEFRDDKRSRDFREWLATDVVVFHDEKLPPGTFNHSDMTQRTNVAARLIAFHVA
jgi:protein-L-isoaspartate O-methyltransferase